MKQTFTPDYIRKNKGCYDIEQVNTLSFIGKEEISIKDILNSEISLRDKRWFVYNKCELTLKERIELATKLAKSVLYIYEAKYQNDKRVANCLNGIDQFNEGKITRDELLGLRKNCRAAAAAAADADAAYAAYAAAYAAYAAAYAADADAADTAAAYAAAADADAAYAAAAEKKVTNIIIEFFKSKANV